jgi:hypothetical protein
MIALRLLTLCTIITHGYDNEALAPPAKRPYDHTGGYYRRPFSSVERL